VFLAVRSWPAGTPAARSRPAAEPDNGATADSSSGPAPGASSPPAAGSPTVPPTPDGPVLVVQEANGDLNLTPATAVLHGESLRVESGAEGEEIRGWTPENRAEWHFRLVRPGAFRLEMRYLLEPGGEGGQVELSIDDRPVKVRTLSFSSVAGATGSEAAEVSDQFYVAIPRSGPHRLSVRAVSPPGEQPMALREIRLLAPSTATADP
ncbi:MAG: hypothetical protein J5I93_16680, partial [Pirellulaceae bacterium]|nr:hypothetical protein [Pirellulaceae bacterium]